MKCSSPKEPWSVGGGGRRRKARGETAEKRRETSEGGPSARCEWSGGALGARAVGAAERRKCEERSAYEREREPVSGARKRWA